MPNRKAVNLILNDERENGAAGVGNTIPQKYKRIDFQIPVRAIRRSKKDYETVCKCLMLCGIGRIHADAILAVARKESGGVFLVHSNDPNDIEIRITLTP